MSSSSSGSGALLASIRSSSIRLRSESFILNPGSGGAKATCSVNLSLYPVSFSAKYIKGFSKLKFDFAEIS